MAYKSNLDKMLEAVLLDEQLMKFGKYEAYEVGNIYQALESDNYVINVVAQIIKRCSEDDAKESEIWREASVESLISFARRQSIKAAEINDYLKRNV